MCGIFGVINNINAPSIIINALKKLEYRGYDSAGLVTTAHNKFTRIRIAGKVEQLEQKFNNQPFSASIGIGHTRWATHGFPNENNAHPHIIGKVAIVHNGIIENYSTIKKELEQKYQFHTDTDSEIIAAQINYFLDLGYDKFTSVSNSLKKFHGNYAICILFSDDDNLIIGAKNGSPLSIGIGDNENYFSSDILSLNAYVKNVINLEDGDIAILTKNSVEIKDINGLPLKRDIAPIEKTLEDIDKGSFPHFMLKEIFEQVRSIASSIEEYIDKNLYTFKTTTLPDFKNIDTINIVACGTSFYAANVAKYWLEELTTLTINIDIGSEYRYRPIKNVPSNSLVIFISQSGETADTLASLKYSKELGFDTLSIINTPSSSMARLSDYVLYTKAGPEIGVASTKAFTSQLIVLLTLVLNAALVRGDIHPKSLFNLLKEIVELPLTIKEILDDASYYKELAEKIAPSSSTIFLGRGISYPIAAEGALKLKELSYIHAEAFPAGELKHGPIALIDSQIYIIALALNDRLHSKTLSNLQEVYARMGKLICLCNEENKADLSPIAENLIVLPSINPLLSPIIAVIPLQLIAYYAAFSKNLDVDKPRNLAKSVTVE
jgi:glucosamine--fructose-6-phosphate aminotransferase (isomerizing)